MSSAHTEPAASSLPAVPTRVVVASLQASSVLGDVTGNTKKFTALAEEAAAKGAKFLVLPEAAISGYLSQDLETNWITPERKAEGLKRFRGESDPGAAAETVPGATTERFCALARRLGVYITVPLLEVAEREVPQGDETDHGAAATTAEKERVYYNAVCLAGPDGALRAHYRKTSPWPTPEQSWATAGGDVAYADTEYGRVGLAICFDIHSVLAKYARHGIWALLYPIAWVGEPREWFRESLPWLLRESNVPHYVIGCNWSTDEKHEWPGAGFSTHYGPRGEVLGGTSDQVGSTIVCSELPTAGGMPRVGHLDLDKYAEWTHTVGGQAKEWRWF